MGSGTSGTRLGRVQAGWGQKRQTPERENNSSVGPEIRSIFGFVFAGPDRAPIIRCLVVFHTPGCGLAGHFRCVRCWFVFVLCPGGDSADARVEWESTTRCGVEAGASSLGNGRQVDVYISQSLGRCSIASSLCNDPNETMLLHVPGDLLFYNEVFQSSAQLGSIRNW